MYEKSQPSGWLFFVPEIRHAETQLAEIDENLCRSELTPTQEAEHLARADKLGPDLHAVIGTSLDKAGELDALKDMEPEARRPLIEAAQRGVQVSARAANLHSFVGGLDGRLSHRPTKNP